MKLEVIATNLDDVGIISKSNADRIEFCSHMEKGGLTPKRSLVRRALKIKSDKPIKVMIRPTAKSYTLTRWQYIKMFIQVWRFCHVKKVQGLVFGVLNKDNEIDINRMGRLIHMCKWYKKTVTFHRAIDLVPNYEIAFNTLHELAVDTVLTTGGATDIDDNLKMLNILKNMKEVTVMAGGGVTLDNCKRVAAVADEIHVGSAIRLNHDWKEHIDLETINAIKAKID